MTTIPLNVSVTAAFIDDGNGGTVARVETAPTVYGSTWHVRRIVVNTTSSGINGSSVFKLYRVNEQPSNMVDGTYSGDQDVDETQFGLMALEKLIFVWTGGDLGAIATAVISGEVDTGRRL